jgi:hypothetical protein
MQAGPPLMPRNPERNRPERWAFRWWLVTVPAACLLVAGLLTVFGPALRHVGALGNVSLRGLGRFETLLVLALALIGLVLVVRFWLGRRPRV